MVTGTEDPALKKQQKYSSTLLSSLSLLKLMHHWNNSKFTGKSSKYDKWKQWSQLFEVDIYAELCEVINFETK